MILPSQERRRYKVDWAVLCIWVTETFFNNGPNFSLAHKTEAYIYIYILAQVSIEILFSGLFALRVPNIFCVLILYHNIL